MKLITPRPRSELYKRVQKLRERVERQAGELDITYNAFRRAVGIRRRDSRRLNQARRILAEAGVLAFPVVDGVLKRRSEQPWSSFSDAGTRVVCRLRGARSRYEAGEEDVVAATTAEVTPSADLFITDVNHLLVTPADGLHPRPLYPHQRQAIAALSAKMQASCSGVLVLPTGGGKTRTAVQWLLANVVDQGQKVLWLAHRHSLIDQACNEFCRNAYRGDVLRQTERFSCRKVSGRHARPFDLTPQDNVVVASVFSIGRGNGSRFLKTKWLTDATPVFLVVDEAHHAVAPTYRSVIDTVKQRNPGTRVLGLTATPFRTAEREQGLLKRVFPDDIVFRADMQALVTQGILAQPRFEDIVTGEAFDLDDDAIEKLRRSGGEFAALGEELGRSIGENRRRNRCIVDRYVQHRKQYGKTIIFALNIANAIALTKLLNNRGVRAAYVVSSIHDGDHKVSIGAEENARVIGEFKDDKFDVLVNVNILTEGFDDPKVKTVFLARPTMSSVLMMQMVGRALRGPKANGTETANIVCFIDDWADKIHWKSPTALVEREAAEFGETPRERTRSTTRLVAISLIENYATLLDRDMGDDVYGDLRFVERLPVGCYAPQMTIEGGDGHAAEDGIVEEQGSTVLVFRGMEAAFEALLDDLPDEPPSPETSTFDKLAVKLQRKHFGAVLGLPLAPTLDDVRTLIGHKRETGASPKYLPFDARGRFDIDALAQKLRSDNIGFNELPQRINQEWERSETEWRTFFGDNRDRFINAVWQTLNPARATGTPNVAEGRKPVEECSLSELYESRPDLWRELRDDVYEKARDRKTGRYRCAVTGWESPNQSEFQIDHIEPRSLGGKTVPANLRLVKRLANAIKGARAV